MGSGLTTCSFALDLLYEDGQIGPALAWLSSRQPLGKVETSDGFIGELKIERDF